ncbi:MAG: glycosyltransferase, partial [Rectinemataceae bacterium]
MKILHLINTLESGGAERLVADIASAQASSGHSVTVAACSGRNAAFAVPLEKSGIEVIFLSVRGSPKNPLLIGRISALYDSLKPDTVHVHLFPAQYYAIAASRLAKHKPVFVTTEHSSGNRRLGRPWWRVPERAVYSRYSAIVAVGEDVARIYAKWTGLGSKIRMIPNGLDVGAFSKPVDAGTRRKMRDSFGTDERQRVIGWVGRLTPPKRPEDLIRAVCELPEKYYAVLVGDGTLRKESEALAESLGIGKRVKFLGDRSDIPELLAAFDAFVLSSDYEGFGLA